jgi:hypothetical protein
MGNLTVWREFVTTITLPYPIVDYLSGRNGPCKSGKRFTNQSTEKTEKTQDLGGETLPIKAIKANLPQRSHLKAAPQGYAG